MVPSRALPSLVGPAARSAAAAASARRSGFAGGTLSGDVYDGASRSRRRPTTAISPCDRPPRPRAICLAPLASMAQLDSSGGAHLSPVLRNRTKASSSMGAWRCFAAGADQRGRRAAAGGSGGRSGEEEPKMSNRAAFRATPVHPSILAHIEKIGVGIRSKPKRRMRKRFAADGDEPRGRGRGGRGRAARGEILDEAEELEYLNDRERRRPARPPDAKKSGRNDKVASPEVKGAHWLPPPPFSTFTKGASGNDDTLDGRKVRRRPVQVLGRAGSLSDRLPRESKGLAEVALAGRSNVGKSTLLNALLYGNSDPNLAPWQHRRGRAQEGAKLPKGSKAVMSDKPGETKEIGFYQLTADVAKRRGRSDVGDDAGGEAKVETAPMSLLLVDLPGYGFAFAKEERAKEWRDLMHHYLLERRSLKRILLLLDARHGFKKSDLDFLRELQDGLASSNASNEEGEGDDRPRKPRRRELPPIQIVLTKCDLVTRPDLARRAVLVRDALSDALVRETSNLPVMLVSARAGLGYNNVRGGVALGGVLELQRELAALVPVPG
ncbi:hypothetical protein ACHAWF_015997 [Thalassiosira exigua]